MIVSIGKKELFSPLKRVSGLCKSHSPLPILDFVLVESDGDTLTFTASNLESQHSSEVLFSSDPFALCVPAGKLTSIVGLLAADQEVRLSFEQPAASVQLRSGHSRHTLNCLPPESFPRFDRSSAAPDERWGVNLEAVALRFALAWVRDSMAVSDHRYFLCGALFESFGENSLTVVASDGHRLSKASVGAVTSESCEGGGRQFILPRNAVLELLKLVPDDEDCRVQLDFMPTALAVSWPGFQSISKSIDGRYPDWRSVSARVSDGLTTFGIDSAAAGAALKRCKLVGDQKSQFKAVSVEIVGDEARFSSSYGGESAFETVPVGDCLGDSITVGFNVDYLIDALASIGGQVSVSLTEGKGFFESASDLDGDCFHVVMPMRL